VVQNRKEVVLWNMTVVANNEVALSKTVGGLSLAATGRTVPFGFGSLLVLQL